MKILAILLLFLSLGLVAQEKFPTNNAIWNVNHINSTGTPTDEMLYGLKGDTLINDTLYSMLFTLSDTTLSVENLQEFIGGFRQEGQKVWFKPAYCTYQDILLYDFSASTGDTIWHNGGAHHNYSKQIEFGFGNGYSIIQEIITENAIKTYSIIRGADGLSGEWYENIGSNFGLFGSIIQFPIIGDTYNLACFKHNDTVKFVNNLECDKCFCTGKASGLVNKNFAANDIKVYPNPVNDVLNIAFVNSGNSFEMLNASGQQVSFVKDAEKNYSMDVTSLSSGIYFLKVKNQNRVLVKKVVIN